MRIEDHRARVGMVRRGEERIGEERRPGDTVFSSAWMKSDEIWQSQSVHYTSLPCAVQCSAE